ncbi:34211_t:CDS:1, partial [Gigaspora margarita]
KLEKIIQVFFLWPMLQHFLRLNSTKTKAMDKVIADNVIDKTTDEKWIKQQTK